MHISGGDTGVGTNGADGLCGDIRDDDDGTLIL